MKKQDLDCLEVCMYACKVNLPLIIISHVCMYVCECMYVGVSHAAGVAGLGYSPEILLIPRQQIQVHPLQESCFGTPHIHAYSHTCIHTYIHFSNILEFIYSNFRIHTVSYKYIHVNHILHLGIENLIHTSKTYIHTLQCLISKKSHTYIHTYIHTFISQVLQKYARGMVTRRETAALMKNRTSKKLAATQPATTEKPAEGIHTYISYIHTYIHTYML
jgi:hypothetical protein